MPRLWVEGPYEFTDLRVLDAGLQVVAVGTERLDVDLASGIYRIQARVPGAVEERLVAVGIEDETTVTGFDLPLDPLAPTARTGHPSHVESAMTESRRTHVTLDIPEARLFVFVRSDGSPRARPALLNIETPERRVIARLDGDGRIEPDTGFAALTVALPAGTYTLTHEAPGLGLRGQAVLVEAGWETQVFIPWDEKGADPGRALVSMVRLGHGFQPQAGWQYEDVEAALDGLARGRVVLTRRDENAFLNAKFENPMLGLIGAYGYLLRGEIDLGRLVTIARNLRTLLPHSPDTQLLQLLAAEPGRIGPAARHIDGPSGATARHRVPETASLVPFESPPMFAAGTDLLLAAAAEDAELISTESWPARVAATRTAGSVWTRWDLRLDPRSQITSLLEWVMSAGGLTDAERARQTGLPRSVVEQMRRELMKPPRRERPRRPRWEPTVRPYQDLTWRQSQILDVIRDSITRRGYPPSHREIAAEVGLASSTVSAHLNELEDMGYIRRNRGTPRAIVLTEEIPHGMTADIPLVGSIAAGAPVLAELPVQEGMSLPRELVGEGDPSELFMLRVRGDSMSDAGIFDGDYVVVRAQPVESTQEDAIVIAMLDDEPEPIVLRLSRSGGRVRLLPANPAYEPIDAEQATILGRVTAVLRQL